MGEGTNHLNHTICDLESAVQSPIREYAKEKRRSTLLRGIPKAIVTTRNRIRQKKEHLARHTKPETRESIIPNHTLRYLSTQATQNEISHSHHTKDSTKRITKSEQCGFPLDNQRRQLMNKNHPIIDSQLPFSSVFIIKPHAVGLLTMGVTN